MSPHPSAAALAGLLAILPAAAAAQTAVPAGAATDDARWVATLQVENDRFVQTDRHYTHGTRLSFAVPGAWLESQKGLFDGMVAETARRARDLGAAFYDDADTRLAVGLSLGQNIYTPENIGDPGLIARDRPYAGWLYGGVSLHAYTDSRLDTIELDFGIVGPAALAEEAQKTVHRMIDATRPRGWDHQLANEPGFLLTFERKQRAWSSPVGDGDLAFEVFPHGGFSVGNVLTSGSIGGTIRFGGNMPRDFGPPRIRPSLPGHDLFGGGPGLGWYLFAGGEGRFVAHNIFLDGNTFENSHRVDREPLVAEIQVGAAIVLPAVGAFRPRLAYAHVQRTREFEGQTHSDRFGAISLTARF
jgi:lipid A 3-O-deacylase